MECRGKLSENEKGQTILLMICPFCRPDGIRTLVVAGQLMISVLLEYFQRLVAERHPINLWRGLGMLLTITGVATY